MTDIYIDMYAEIYIYDNAWLCKRYISARMVKDSENHLFDLSIAKFVSDDIPKLLSDTQLMFLTSSKSTEQR